MLTLHECIQLIISVFCSSETLENARVSPNYFRRNRKMSFQDILYFLITSCKMATQCALTDFFNSIKRDIHMSQQAMSKARNHFDHTPFSSAFNVLRDKEYRLENESNLRRLYGYNIIAVDGSVIPLPNIPKLRQEFGESNGSPSARASMALDIVNDRIVDANLCPMKVDERTMAMEHIEEISKRLTMKKTIFLFDRGYPSKELICKLLCKKAKFIMRVRTKYSKKVDEAPLGSSTIELFDGIVLRCIKFFLPSGEVETLLTNLTKMKTSKFRKLYFKRWGVETKYDVVKNKWEMPNFTGYTKNVILQDFWISMLLTNVTAIAKAEADKNIKLRLSGKKNKHEYQANINTIVFSLRYYLVRIAATTNEAERVRLFNKLINEISHSVVPVRKDRQVGRKTPRNAKYHHNKKSHV